MLLVPLPVPFILKFTGLLALVSNLLLEPFLEIQNYVSPKYCLSSSVGAEVRCFLKDSPGIYMIFPLVQMISKTALLTPPSWRARALAIALNYNSLIRVTRLRIEPADCVCSLAFSFLLSLFLFFFFSSNVKQICIQPPPLLKQTGQQ